MDKKDLNKFLLNEFAFDELFKLELKQKTGSRLFYCGMPLKDLNIMARSFTYKKHYYTKGGFFSLAFIFGDAINVNISISPENENSVVNEVTFFGNYTGKLNNIGIGSMVEELLSLSEDISFDEQYIMVGKRPYDCLIKIDNNDETIRSIDSVKKNLITEITYSSRH